MGEDLIAREDILMALLVPSGLLGQERTLLCQKHQVHQHLWQERGQVLGSIIGGCMRREEETQAMLGFLLHRPF